MSIAVHCPQCVHGFSAPDSLAGKRVKCPKCGSPVAIPVAVPATSGGSLADLLDDRLAVSAPFASPEVAGNVTPPGLPPPPPRPAALVAKSVKRPRMSQLAPFAPALELLGVFILGCGLFGLFAYGVLNYSVTSRDLGICGLFGGMTLFALAQFVKFDRERFGRAVCVLVFLGVASASVGAGVELYSGRMTADAFKFWVPNPAMQLLKDSDRLRDEMTAMILQVNDVQDVQQHAEEFQEFDTRFKELQERAKAFTGEKLKLSESDSDARLQRVQEVNSQLTGHIREILARPRGKDVIAEIKKNMPYFSMVRAIAFDPEAFDRRKRFYEGPKLSVPMHPSDSDTAASAPSLAASVEQQIAAAEASDEQFERERQKASEAAQERIQAVRNAVNAPDSVSDSTDAGGASAARMRDGDRFREEADRAFTFSHDAAGQAYLQAAALAGSDESLKPQLQWCPALKRPAFSLYWAIGVSLEAMSEAPPPDERWKNRRRPLDERRHDVGFWQVDEFKFRTGDVGMGLAEGIQQRLDQREFGDWGAEWDRSKFDLRGLVLFEVGPLGISLQKAREEGIDVLVMLHLHDKKSAAGPYTELQINILKVSDGKSLWHSDVLSDRKLKNDRRKGKDPAADLLATAFAFIDKELRLTKMPTVKPEVARKRAAKVCAEPSIEPIAAVLEVRYYQVQGLLTADEARELYEKKVGAAAAEALATGDELQRETALAEFLSSR